MGLRNTPVNTNLYDAMRTLQDQPFNKFLWIDCLCMDQPIIESAVSKSRRWDKYIVVVDNTSHVVH